MARRNRALNKWTTWILYNLIFPLLPLMAGLIIAFLQSENTYPLQGASSELMFLNVIVWSSTKNDIDSSLINLDESLFYSILSKFIFPLFIALSMIVFVPMYIQENVSDIELNNSITSTVSVISILLSSLVCVTVQAFLAFVSSIGGDK